MSQYIEMKINMDLSKDLYRNILWFHGVCMNVFTNALQYILLKLWCCFFFLRLNMYVGNVQ